MEHIQEAGELKLTPRGNLQVKTIRGLLELNLFTVERWNNYQDKKILKEEDFSFIHLAKILLKMAGLAKVRHSELSLTKTGMKLLKDPDALLQTLFTTYLKEFNWAYFDGYASELIGPAGAGFSLVLLHKYGNQAKPVTFYAAKYFRAFPMLEDTMPPVSYAPHEKHLASCYASRTYDSFLTFFGLVDITARDYRLEQLRNVRKRPLFDALFALYPPKSSVS
ncbi:MAG: hypothetical protein H6555_09965 [Lewinellaceae bacterium]|nr:hypothetical protein [Lewinellaceae bacterium]